MKVALIHDYIKEYGGAERVLEALHEIWPESTVFTTLYFPEFLGPHQLRFRDWKIVTSFWQKIPGASKLISPARLISPWIFENWDFRDFDLIIVSATGAYFPNLILRRPETLHLCYCHTPPRYLYGYPTARNWKKNAFLRFLGETVNHSLRKVDFLSSQRPDYFIANSLEVKRRIEKFYRREATVIYPPVDLKISNKTPKPKSKEKKQYYLAGGRLARAKRLDLAIDACNQLKLPLKVFGKSFADYEEELKEMAGPTIEFVGEVTDSKLADLYLGAKALIYPAEEEDFGIVPVEAMAAGLPVLALYQGGVKETVMDGETGYFFTEPEVKSLVGAIQKFEKKPLNSSACKKQAGKFGKERFKKEIKDFVKEKLSSRDK